MFHARLDAPDSDTRGFFMELGDLNLHFFLDEVL